MAEETQKTFSLRLAGEGVSIEREIDQRAAFQVMQIVMGGGIAADTNSSSAINFSSTVAKEDAPPREREALSLREYLDRIGASKKPEQIATIAHYICDYEMQADFSREDVRSRFLSAREPLPGNFGRDFAVAVKNGWVAEVHGKKNRFYVTAKGIQAIGNSFSNGKGAAARR
jgi:hypothetical protein